ncbi:MAG: T9SS type A sorting domain-containing protein [Bacteroidetes bacterium]|nr:T9SS type A sorting domain-containing protein [Bacteroidota bacterium]
MITTRPSSHLTEFIIPLRDSLRTSTRLMIFVLIMVVIPMEYGNAQVMTTEKETNRPGGNYSLQFDGIDDRVTVPYDASFPTEVFTISAWIKLAQPAGRAAIIARGEDDNSFNLSWHLYVLGNGTLEVMLENSNEQNFCYPINNCVPMGTCIITGDLFVADDIWHHVAVTRDASGTLALYIDGEKRAGCEGTGVPSSNNFQVLSIGCTFGTIGPPPGGTEPPVWFFSGLIDEPAMWNVALSDMQIADVFSVGIDPLSTGLVGYWAFDEGTGQVVVDMSLAGNDGFLGETPQVDSADPIWEGAPVSVEDVSILSDRQMVLAPNYPNPFNPTTQIMFSLPVDSDLRLVVIDVLGRVVKLLAKGRYKAGTYTVTANMKNFTSGLYLYQLDTPTAKLTGKMLLIK